MAVNWQEVVKIWFFVFPAKEDSADWEASLNYLFIFLSSSFLLVDFSQQLLNFWLIFLSRSIMSAKIQIVFTLAGVWHCPFMAFLNPWDFNTLFHCEFVLCNKNLKNQGIQSESLQSWLFIYYNKKLQCQSKFSWSNMIFFKKSFGKIWVSKVPSYISKDPNQF